MVSKPDSYYVEILLLVGTIFLVVLMAYTRVFEKFESTEKTLVEVPFYTKRRITDAPTIISNVPTVIYTSWHSNMVPPRMKDNIYKVLRMNSDFDYYLYSDESSLAYIQKKYSTDVADAFNTLKPGAYKSDLWRYCVLYKDGGVYFDIKFGTVVPLREIIARTPEVFVKDYDAAMVKCSRTNDVDTTARCFYNGFIISPPNNPLFKFCIDEIVESCKMKLYRVNCLDVTGPCLFGRALKKFRFAEWSRPKFIYQREEVDGEVVDYIQYHSKRILVSYLEYRREQKSNQKTEHYGAAWMNYDIYV